MKRAVITIQETGKRPNSAPYTTERPAYCIGMPYAMHATPTASEVAIIAAQWPFIFNTVRAINRKRMGTSATSAESAKFPNGLTFIVQLMASYLLN